MQEDTARDNWILESSFILNKCIYSTITIQLNIQDPTADELLCFDGSVHLQFNGTMQCLQNKRM